MHANEPTDATHPELFSRDFGERLARLVELADLSWEEFAERLGVESGEEARSPRAGKCSTPCA